ELEAAFRAFRRITCGYPSLELEGKRFEKGFFSPKRRGRDNGVKRKQTIMVDVPAKGNDLLNLDTTSVSNVAKDLDQNAQPAPHSVTNILGDNTRNSIEDEANIKKHTSVVSSNTLKVLVVRIMGPISYAKLVNGEPSRKSVNFRTLITMVGNGVDVAIPLDSIRAISESEYGLVKSMLNSFNGLFFFQYSSKDGLNKEDAGNVSSWDKFHGVPMSAFTEDGLSIIATKLGTPLMLDSYTSDMCMHSWGMSSYARAMIKLRADEKLKDTIVVAMPKLILSDVVKNLNNPKQATGGVPFGPNTIDGKLLLVDDDGKPLPKVVSTINADSDSEVLWEQWKETNWDDDYDLY
ncbi:hypothetical protein Tco_0330848, partial [Tanacetum coccineum]